MRTVLKLLQQTRDGPSSNNVYCYAVRLGTEPNAELRRMEYSADSVQQALRAHDDPRSVLS